MTRISEIGERGREAGFTLTELTVVLAIMGLLAGAVLVAAPSGSRSLVDEAERFGAHLIRAKDEAVLTGRTVEVHITGRGYGFDVRRAGARIALDAPPFRAADWDGETTAVVAGAGESSRIAFDPTGIASPTEVDLYRQNSRVRVSVDAGGSVRIDALAR